MRARIAKGSPRRKKAHGSCSMAGGVTSAAARRTVKRGAITRTPGSLRRVSQSDPEPQTLLRVQQLEDGARVARGELERRLAQADAALAHDGPRVGVERVGHDAPVDLVAHRHLE